MPLDRITCYNAMLARDARYDGRFFTCVTSTGIYCRPICPARPPKLENCIFVPTAAAAQEAGFRSCLRCRPESSPDLGAWRGSSATVSRALRLIEQGALDCASVEDLAGRLGIGERQLRRLFRKHLGATPIAVAQTRRVLLAKQLIHETDLSMTDIALASGFGSIRRFNETFRQIYRRPPSELRRRRPEATGAAGTSLLLRYRPPYDWSAMLDFLRTRLVSGLECIDNDGYSRVIELGGEFGTVTVSHAPEHSALRATVHFPRLNALPTIIARLRRMFDLSADTEAIESVLSRDPGLAPLVAARPGLRLPGAWDGFETAVRAVLGQQITVAAANRLASRLVEALGTAIADASGRGRLSHAFPAPGRFDAERIAAIGMPGQRAATLAGLARAAESEPKLFEPGRNLEEAVAELRRLPGIGEWTAQYIAMRALHEPDAFLAGDVALQRTLQAAGRRPTARELLVRAESWRPWRAYAVLHLWTAEASRKAATIDEARHAATA